MIWPTGARAAIAFILLALLICDCHCDDKNPLIFSTSECLLTEPVYGHKFDFGALHSDFAHQAISDKGDKFEFNICGNLTRSCDGRDNVAACLKRGDKEFVLGTQHTLNYHLGKMYFSFTNGAKCPNGDGDGEFQLIVFVACDYTLDKIQSVVTTYAKDACSFYITLETPHACLPEPDAVKSNTCSVKDPQTGHTYDLLSLSDFNYRTTDRNGSAFVINICKPVLYGENALCPAGSSVCFISSSSTDFKKKYFNYGTVQPNPVIENDQLLMRHPSDTSCNATHNYSSIINFYCDKDVKNAYPVLIGVHGCVYEFSFITPLACNNMAPCTTITHGSEILDMTSLQDKPFTLVVKDKSYTFAVCSHAGSPCLDNDGACLAQGQQSTSLGTYNTHLRFNQTGSPYLLYEGGANCQKMNDVTAPNSSTTSTNWSTKIEFICANGTAAAAATAATSDKSSRPGSNDDVPSTALGPKIIENSNCQLLIHYQTPLACQEQIACKAVVYAENPEDGVGGTLSETVDLTPLISATENYEAQVDLSSTSDEPQLPKSTKFFLNVCRPLVPKFGLGCPGGSAACMAKVTSSTSTPEGEQSLGFPMASLVAINRTTAELRYFKGSDCPTKKNTQLSSGIRVYCDMRAGRGVPVLRAITDCHYQFEWATNVICPPHTCTFNADTCEITNDEINVSYNLKKAPFANKGVITIEKGNHKFELDLCGSHRHAVTDYSEGLVNLFFSAEGPCGTAIGLINVQMRLICSSDNERATTFSNDKECNLVYVQRTPDICKFLGLTKPPATGETKSTTATPTATTTTTTTATESSTGTTADTKSNSDDNGNSHPAEKTSSIGAILAAILSLTCFVACLGVFAFSPERRNTVRRLFRRSTSAVRYSRVQSNEEANLLLEPNGEFTDSDDDMLL